MIVVILPSVVKVVFDSLFHLNVNILAFVELLDQPEKLREVVTVVKAPADGFGLV